MGSPKKTLGPSVKVFGGGSVKHGKIACVVPKFHQLSWVRPKRLEDLFPVFDRLEGGESVALLPPEFAGSVPAPPDGTAVWLGVTSSGSTGRPQLVWRAWDALKAGASRAERVRGWRWASPYDPWSFAGAQVAVQAWVGHVAGVSLRGDWAAIWRTLVEQRLEALSCTPTFADLLLQHEPAAGANWTPRQITLGGEPLRPATGARLRRRWPETRMRAIYAAAEFGVLLKTERTDGWYELAGWERAGWRWRVRELEEQKAPGGGAARYRKRGELELCPVNERGTVHWRSTGDRVEVDEEAGLMRVIGRADEVANVAGVKVSLAEVAALAEAVPGVRRAVAVARPNPVTGQVVALRFALDPVADEPVVQDRLAVTLRRRLPKPAWPREWIRDEVGLGKNAKRARE